MSQRIFNLLLIIISLPIVLSYGSPRIFDKIAKERTDNLNYKLTENVFPEHYTLKITTQFNNKSFIGSVKILIHVKIPTSNITLHNKYLNITKEKIYLTTRDDLVINIKDAGESGTIEQEFYTITFQEILNENTYYLHIPEYYGPLLETQKGFHYAHYTEANGKLREFATTFFESTAARFVFPCFDEPFFRAKFKIYITRPPNYHSESNMKLIKSLKLNNSLYEDEFEDTVSMSTYLVAFTVSEMKISTSPDSNFFRIIARPEVLNKGYEKSSLKLSVKLLQTCETYFNINYTLNKVDQALVPDEHFPASGMENWGLIKYSESSFLITPRTTMKKQLKLSAVIAHELVHQWFGNLVTVKWWRYLWLKEGFAQFLESRILDIVKPEWRLMEQYVAVEKHDILEQDSLNLNRNMNQDAGKPNEISHLYDRISYEKAGCVIHMIETVMTQNIFKLGITNYLKDRAFQAAIPTDLYRNFQKSLDNFAVELPQNLSIEKIMTTWVTQSGYPLVYVERDYDKNQQVIKLTQSLYIQKIDTANSTTWYIPINYASKSNSNFNDTRCSNWLLKPNETITINNLKYDDWLILNKQQAFYYRVNYDVKNWKLIAKALKENYRSIHLLNRVQIIDDSFSLAKMNKIDFSIPLEICTYLYEEDDYIIHTVFLRNIDHITKIIRRSKVERSFQIYITESLKRSYRRLGNNHGSTDTLIDKLHRVEVARWMCKFNYSQCRANYWKIFDQWRKNNKSFEVDIEDDVMCNAMRYGNEDDWNYLFEKYESASDYQFGKININWLACTENVAILKKFMDSALNSPKNYFFSELVGIISNQGSVGLNVSKHYIIENFKDLEAQFPSRIIELLFIVIIQKFTTEAELDEFRELIPTNISSDWRWELAFDSARILISKQKNHRKQILKFFDSYNPDQGRSDGNLCHGLPNIFILILYSFVIIVIVYP